MACPHNQAAINVLNSEIDALEKDIDAMNENIKKCKDIIEKHKSFCKELDCVMNNLEGNYVKAGEDYDKGAMMDCYYEAEKTIIDCNNIITESEIQIKSKEKEITDKEAKINSLHGDCADCSKL